MENKINLINSTTLFKFFSPTEVRNNLNKGNFRIVSYQKNSVIHFDGDLCTKMEIILTGKVIINRIDEEGNLLTISEFYADDILGANTLFSQSPYYPMTVSAQLPTLILEINKDVLFELLCSNPTFLKAYLEFVSEHAFILGSKLKHSVNKTIRESIMGYLDAESKRQNSNCVKLNLTKKALAERIGAQRTSLSRELSKMKKDGLILFDKNTITLLR